MIEISQEVALAVDTLVARAVDGEVTERDLDLVVTRLQVPAVAYREVIVELEERGVVVVPVDTDAPAGAQAPRPISTRTGPRDGFGAWLKAAGDHRLLTAEEEQDLGRRVQNAYRAEAYLHEHGDGLKPRQRRALEERIRDGEVARNELVRCNVRLAVFVAKRYFPHVSRLSMENEDVLQEAMFGLNRAAEKFDPTKGNKFSTYATWWLRQSITRGIEKRGYLVRLPSHVHVLIAKMRKYLRECEAKQQEIDVREAAKRLNISEEHAGDILVLATGGGVGAVRSLDIPIGDDGASSLLDVLEDTESPSVEEEALRTATSEIVEMLLETRLTERERLVIRLRHGFGEEPMTLEAIGERLGLTRERIRQIQAGAEAKLSEPSVVKLLLAA